MSQMPPGDQPSGFTLPEVVITPGPDFDPTPAPKPAPARPAAPRQAAPAPAPVKAASVLPSVKGVPRAVWGLGIAAGLALAFHKKLERLTR